MPYRWRMEVRNGTLKETPDMKKKPDPNPLSPDSDSNGQASACGWCQDRWGLSWQITPRALIEAISDPDVAAARRG